MNSLLAFLDTAGKSALPMFINFTWQSTLLMLAIFCINRFIVKKQTIARHFLWLVALIGCLILPLLNTTTAQWRPGKLVHQPYIRLASSRIEHSDNLYTNTHHVMKERQETSFVSSKMLDSNKMTALPSSEPNRFLQFRQHWRGIAFVFWLLGATFIGVRLLNSYLCIRNIRRKAERETDASCGVDSTPLGTAHTLSNFYSLTKKMSIRRKVSLLISEHISVPITMGVFSPAILLPKALSPKLTESEMKAVLAHELAHVKRNDYPVNLFQRVLQAIFFFHPLIHFAVRQANRECEHICDDWVLSTTGQSATYARSLAKLLNNCQNLPAKLRTAPAIFGRKSHIARRIMLILNSERKPVTHLSWRVLGALAVVGCLLIAAVATSQVMETSRAGGSPVPSNDGASHEPKPVIAGDSMKDTSPKQLEDVLRGIRLAQAEITSGKLKIIYKLDVSPIKSQEEANAEAQVLIRELSGELSSEEQKRPRDRTEEWYLAFEVAYSAKTGEPIRACRLVQKDIRGRAHWPAETIAFSEGVYGATLAGVMHPLMISNAPPCITAPPGCDTSTYELGQLMDKFIETNLQKQDIESFALLKGSQSEYVFSYRVGKEKQILKRVVINVEKGFGVKRIEYFNPPDAQQPSSVAEFLEYRRSKANIWYPRKINRVGYTMKGTTRKISSIEEWNIVEAQFNISFPDDFFQRNGKAPSLQVIDSGMINELKKGVYQIGNVIMNTNTREVTAPGEINMPSGIIEYFACAKLGKTHESLMVLDIEPIHLQVALLRLGMKEGSSLRTQGDPRIPKGDPAEIWVEWELGGKRFRHRVEDFIYNGVKKSPMQHTNWVFTGARIVSGVFTAQTHKNMIATYRDPDAIFNHPLEGGREDTTYRVNSNVVPPVGTKLKVIIKPIKKPEGQRN